MEAELIKVSTAGEDDLRLTINMKRQKLTVDILEFIGKKLDVRIPDERPAE